MRGSAFIVWPASWINHMLMSCSCIDQQNAIIATAKDSQRKSFYFSQHFQLVIFILSHLYVLRTVSMFFVEKELSRRSSSQVNDAISPKLNVSSEVHRILIFKHLQETLY